MAGASPEAGPMLPLGPGRFVMVVGPSGVGKDSLIRASRDALAGDDHYVFPRRLVTRPSSEAEDNAEITMDAFERLRGEGAFAVSWTAHGLGYALPRDIDEDIARGRTVICNVSRHAVRDLRERYGNTVVVAIDAPREVLERRLAARKRGEDGPLDRRLARAAPAPEDLRPDALIVNAGTLEAAAAAFLDAIR